MPLTVRMAVGHAHFEAVHPFCDGNGRVGRMLWPLQMLLADLAPLYLSGYVEAEKDSYYRALEIAQKKLNYSTLIEFVCEAIVISYDESVKTRQTLLSLPQNWRERSKFRQGSASERCLDLLITSPVLAVKDLATTLKISFQAAAVALKKIEQEGIVRERTGFGRNRVFAAEEVIAILSRKFGEDPAIALSHARKMLQH